MVSSRWSPVTGGAGTSDLGFLSVDEPRCPVQAFHPQSERRLGALVGFARPIVEHRPVCLKSQGWLLVVTSQHELAHLTPNT